jgi:hypothetical protein
VTRRSMDMNVFIESFSGDGQVAIFYVTPISAHVSSRKNQECEQCVKGWGKWLESGDNAVLVIPATPAPSSSRQWIPAPRG